MEAHQSVTIRRGLKWVGIASGAVGALDAITNVIVLWLWVSPAELGIATMASALFPILDRLGTLGLGQAAVRAPDDRRTMSSIAWLGMLAALATSGVLIAVAAPIGSAFDHPVVGALLAAYGAKLVMASLQLVPEALLKRELRFRPLSVVRMVAQIVESCAKIGAAAIGLHVWCFAVAPLANALVTLIGVQIIHPWRPAWTFDARAAFKAARFGLQVSIGEMLYFAYTSLDYVVIGRVFGDAAVGAYRLAYELVLDIVRMISMVTGEVAFAAFARLPREQAGALLVRMTRQNLLVIAPLLVGIGVGAGDWLSLLYPPLGPGAATAAQILCAVGALRAASFVLPPMLAGLGHPRDGLIYNAFAAITMPAAFVVGSQVADTYLGVAWAWAIAYPFAFALVLWFALRRTSLSLVTYAKGITRVVGCALASLAVALVIPNGIAAGVVAALIYLALVRLTGADRR